MAAVLVAVGAEWAVGSLESADAGASLDEGRVQQLAIARALLADPAVVILDEATADVGLHHRDAVEDAIRVLRRDRTSVLIAHRLEPVSTAEQIVVFADGRAVQRGTHDELLAEEGLYRSFWLAQAG